MTILDQLSSRTGDRTEASNKAVASQCLAEPDLLAEVAIGLQDEDAKLAGDCAEVMTKVASEQPAMVLAYADDLIGLLDHPATRTRWEAMHSLALIAPWIPGKIGACLPTLQQHIRSDTSVIVRDYAVDCLASYADSGSDQARAVFPLLIDCLTLWDGKQAGHALLGLGNIARHRPELAETIRPLAQRQLSHPRAVVRKAAERLLRSLG